MRNLKKLITPAVAGFVLSFIISLIATKGNFGAAFLRGLIFAVVFAGLFFLVDFVFNKFLDGTAGDVSSKKNSDPGLGAKVDITLSDEDLADDGEDLKFFVGHNKVGLNQAGSDVPPSPNTREPSSPKPVSPVDGSPKVQPVSEGTVSQPSKPQTVSAGAEIKTDAQTKSSETENSFRAVPLSSSAPVATTVPRNGEAEKVSDVDSLPEISDFDSELGTDEDSIAGSESDEVLNDTDFSGSNESLYSRRKPADDVSSGRDAATLAKAIQTILKRDE